MGCGSRGSGFELGVKLAAEKPGVVFEFDDLDQLVFRIFSRDDEPGIGQNLFISGIEFEPVTMPFIDIGALVDLICQGILLYPAEVLSQPHGSSQVGNSFELSPFEKDLMGRDFFRIPCCWLP